MFLLIMAGCVTNWIHPEGYDNNKLKEDKKACEATTQNQIKKQYGYAPCKEYAIEKGLEKPAYGINIWGTTIEPEPNSRDYKKAYRECTIFQKAAFESCMENKGWQKQ